MYGTVDKRVEVYNVHVESNVIDSFGIELQCVNAEKPVLTYLPNADLFLGGAWPERFGECTRFIP